MATNQVLQRLNEPSWRKGFTNILRKESRDWWRTRRWWVHFVIWLLLLNTAIAAPLWLQSSALPEESTLSAEEQQQWIENSKLENRIQQAVRTLVDASGLLLLLGVVIVMQNSIIDEKQTGTSAWILSKPVARNSFILAKFVANAGALLVLAVVAQWTIAYIQISIASGAVPPILPYVLAMGLIALNTVFWLGLTLMLGTLSNNRGIVLAIPLAVLFGLLFVTSHVPALLDYTPLAFIMDMPDKRSLVQLVMQGRPLPTIMPIVMTAVWCMLFVAAAIWRFGREEF